VALDDAFDPFVLVARTDEELCPVGPHVLVFVERRLHAVRAFVIAALAYEVRVLGIEALGAFGDSLVDVAEQRFRSRDAFIL
jgi:hypothetical protein